MVEAVAELVSTQVASRGVCVSHVEVLLDEGVREEHSARAVAVATREVAVGDIGNDFDTVRPPTALRSARALVSVTLWERSRRGDVLDGGVCFLALGEELVDRLGEVRLLSEEQKAGEEVGEAVLLAGDVLEIDVEGLVVLEPAPVLGCTRAVLGHEANDG